MSGSNVHGARPQVAELNAALDAEVHQSFGAAQIAGLTGLKRESYRVGPNVASWPNILTVNSY
jgi:hypothetical protein